MSSTGLTRPRPKTWCQKRFTIARPKYGLSGEASQLASTGRYGSLLVIFGSAPPRNLALTFIADSGSMFFLFGVLSDSRMPGAMPFLAAWFGLAVRRTFMKNWAMPQY